MMLAFLVETLTVALTKVALVFADRLKPGLDLSISAEKASQPHESVSYELLGRGILANNGCEANIFYDTGLRKPGSRHELEGTNDSESSNGLPKPSHHAVA